MCYGYGSIDQAINVCPMCKVFPHPRCPHLRQVCRNRTLHPRFDVLYMTNAEVDWFNGCGYCKFARSDPPAKLSGFANPGWPGCCRAPMQHEFALIPAFVWRSVNIVHHVPIPPEIRTFLDASKAALTPTGSLRGPRKPLTSSSDRKGSANSSPTSKSTTLPGKTASIAMPGKSRAGGSPQQQTASLSRNTNIAALSSSVPTVSSVDQHYSQRRQALVDGGEKRTDGSPSSHPSPSRKLLDLDPSLTPRHSTSAARRTNQATVTSNTPASTLNIDSRSQASASKPLHQTRTTERPPSLSLIVPQSPKKQDDELSSASSSSGSSDGTGSLSDSTITSDGAFTDYLSDESEAELQRQAEARAALLAQTQVEEMEFKAARLQLAHVDLRPPKSWIPTNGADGGTLRASASVRTAKSTAGSGPICVGSGRDKL
ncbi:hypothetical protein AX17_001230 [Amanita inopinata Kibby_2008]|nr:hypothetical protein AX17_001230 [Amanita inopinata Kibby_2008]